MIWAAVAIAFVLAVAFVATRRMRASVSLQAMASDEGWALAGGAKVGPIAASAARMRGANGAWAVHLFGRKMIGSGVVREKKPKKKSDAKIARRAWRVGKEIDPIVAIELALDALGRVRVESLSLRVRGGDPDPLLMGRVAAVLAVASGLLAPVATIDAALDWTADAPSLDVRFEGEVSFVPAALALDAARWLARQIVLRIRTAVTPRRAQLQRA